MRRPWALLTSTLLLGLVACSGDPVPTSSPATRSSVEPSAAPSASPSRATPSPSPTPAPKPKPEPEPSTAPHPISLRALAEKDYDGSRLDRHELLTDAGPYKRYRITYRSDGLTVSGIMNVPDGRGPFPVVVLAHGYIDPATYFPGQGMPREQDVLARQGYVVLHTDYRGHATSQNEKGGTAQVDYELRLPYAVDAINAALAVEDSDFSYLDRDKIGIFGRSMGGGVALTAIAARPDVFDAAVVWASVSSLAADNWRTWYRDRPDRPGREDVNERIERTYGLPDASPAFWRAASPRDSFGRITVPVQLHHGTADDTCPIAWSRASAKALTAAGVDADLFSYDGAGHTFEGRDFTRGIERTTRFFDEQLG
jgi:dipeptidyl aminopeptidase/acylaminoacyl peptidase